MRDVCKGSAGIELKAVVKNRWIQRVAGACVLVPSAVHERIHVTADDDHESRESEGGQGRPLGRHGAGPLRQGSLIRQSTICAKIITEMRGADFFF